jgi:MFS family permease
MFILGKMHVKTKRTGVSIDFDNIMGVLKNRRFILLTISALVANAALGANGSYMAVLIEKTGGDISNLGMLWFIIAMSELPVFFFGKKIMKKYGVLNVYLIGIGLYVIRFLADSLSTSYQAVLAVQFLQGITFTLYLITTLQYINDTVPPETRTSAMTVFNAVAGGIGGFIGNMGGGFLLQRANVFSLFRIMSVLCIFSLLIGLILKSIDIRNRVISN